MPGTNIPVNDPKDPGENPGSGFVTLVSTWGVESTIAEFAIAQARLNFMDSQGWGTNPSLQSQYDALDARVAELQMQLMYLAMPDLAQQVKQTNPGVGLP